MLSGRRVRRMDAPIHTASKSPSPFPSFVEHSTLDDGTERKRANGMFAPFAITLHPFLHLLHVRASSSIIAVFVVATAIAEGMRGRPDQRQLSSESANTSLPHVLTSSSTSALPRPGIPTSTNPSPPTQSPHVSSPAELPSRPLPSRFDVDGTHRRPESKAPESTCAEVGYAHPEHPSPPPNIHRRYRSQAGERGIMMPARSLLVRLAPSIVSLLSSTRAVSS